jgi:hypothetical protein
MARQSGIYSTPEKYTQPCEIGLNIAEYTTTLKTFISTFQKITTGTIKNTWQHFFV